jgi:MFS family permease
LIGTFTAFLVLRAIASCAFGGLYGLVGIMAATNSPRDAKGTAFGLMGAASSMGFGAGPLLGGAIAAAVGIRPVFIISAITIGCIPLVIGLAAAASPLRRRWGSTSPRVASDRI